MEEIIGILVACALITAATWIFMRGIDKPENPEEDEEQREYLEHWKKEHEEKE